ncbi:MAG: 50S ribosomal protein L13 [Alphaproteobacteria bacterium]|jgi:large subunit ribosomal protein L13
MYTEATKTYTGKISDIQRNWYIIDAENLVLGRLASHVAMLLRGKHKPNYVPYLDYGDNVIIINAEKVHLTGKKLTDKVFYWHTGYVGGVKSITPKETLASRFPDRLITRAVERMITRSPLGRQQMRKLFVYAGPTHPHEAQMPKVIDFGSKNRKNKKTV